MKDKRFIEYTFPIKEVSAESTKEKNIRHGHISTLHIWWARRPLASSRATAYAALIPEPKDEKEANQKRDFIIELSKWENSLNQTIIEKARKDILVANGGKPPKVLDPFGGGGAIPLEALRLGCETYTGDYNPVAVLIQKCTLEYPQKYGKPGEVEIETEEFGKKVKKNVKVENKLLEDVKKWGKWVLEEAKKEIGEFYPPEEDASNPLAYIWARTINCQNPLCIAEIPLFRQYWLANKNNKKVCLYPFIQENEIKFKILGTGYEKIPHKFDPLVGTISGAIVLCPICSTTIDGNTTRKLFQEGKSGERLVAVVLHKEDQSGKRYRVANSHDLEVLNKVETFLENKRQKIIEEWGIDPIPDEPIQTPSGKEYSKENIFYFNFTPVVLYGMTKWRDLFNPRQKLALLTFTEKVRQAYQEMSKEAYEKNYIKVICTYLSLALSRHASYNSKLCWWEPLGERCFNTFGRQALPMVFDFSIQNPFETLTGNWLTQLEITSNILDHLSSQSLRNSNTKVNQITADKLEFPDNYFDAVFTDPPYYDNVPYSYLSDFFYVWLKRSTGHLYPDLFSTPLTPKTNEAIAELPLLRGMKKDEATKILNNIKTKETFEAMLKKSFAETHRILKPYGIAIIVYAHKSLSGWETLINSLLDSGLVITAALPINTEMQTRLRANQSASLASSIYIIARKIERKPTGFYNDVREELKTEINEKLDRLWQEGISGADFFISAIGSAIEVFGKYEKVIDYEGNEVRADRLLDEVQKIATDYAVRQILHNGFAGEISDLTRFYVLYRWEYGHAKVHFDEARKLGQSCGIDISREWGKDGFIKKDKEFINLLSPSERKLEDLERSHELIDILHSVLLLWEKSKRDEMLNLLNETGYGDSEAFYRVAQAVSETLGSESKEKKLLDGFLSGRERLKEEVRSKKDPAQRRLFE